MLTGKHIKLVPYSDRYLDFVYGMESNLDERYLWSDARAYVSKEEFAEGFHRKIERDYFNYFIIASTEGQPLGVIYAYRYHPWDHFLYLTTYVVKEARGTYAAAEGGILMINYLFHYYRLNKIYTLVYDYNKDSLNYQLNAGFSEEGLLKRHRYYAGQFHDAHLLALYPDVFYKRFDGLLTQIFKNGDEVVM